MLNGILIIIACAFIIWYGAVTYIAWCHEDKHFLRKWAPLCFVSAAFFIVSASVTVIPTGYTGVKTTFGQIYEHTLPNGLNWHIPIIQSIEKVNNKQQDVEFEGKTWSETKERTALYYENVTVTYRINSEKSSWIFANVSDYKKNLVTAELTASALKSSSKQLTDTDATNRSIIEPLCKDNLQKLIDTKYGKDVIAINNVTISGADFDESYNNAVANKQKAQLEYEQAAITNKKNVEKAEADAKTTKIKAQAKADAAVIKAEGDAKANKKLNEFLTDNVLKSLYLDKWDGALPKTSLSDGNILYSITD